MTTSNRPMVLAVGAVLFAMAAPPSMSSAVASTSMTLKPSGFLTESLQRAPSTAGETLTAELPHLRLTIELTRIQNVVVAGSGVISYGYPHASVKIMSNAADISVPTAAGAALEFPTPTSGHTWNLADNAVYAASVNPLFVGVIENGCMGAPAMFDLSLDSTIFVPHEKGLLGAVHLTDTVYGPGNYNLEYTVRASDANGNVSDIKFSGRAKSNCTGQLGTGTATDWAAIIGSSSSFDATRGTAAADSVTCRPGTADWCANGFQTACDEQNGSLSSEPDGGVTCTYPESESGDGTSELITQKTVLPPPSELGFRQTSTTRSGWISLTCHGGDNCTAFADRCDAHGGGASTEPDGGVTCTVPDDNCSACH